MISAIVRFGLVSAIFFTAVPPLIRAEYLPLSETDEWIEPYPMYRSDMNNGDQEDEVDAPAKDEDSYDDKDDTESTADEGDAYAIKREVAASMASDGTSASLRRESVESPQMEEKAKSDGVKGGDTNNDIVRMTHSTKLTIIASLCSVAAVFVILTGTLCYVRFNKLIPNTAMEKVKEKLTTLRGRGSGTRGGESHFDNADAERGDEESEDDENEDADFTVYECEGPASAGGEMEIRNPMFQSKVEADH